MHVVSEQPERNPDYLYLRMPGTEVRGVELDNNQDALMLAAALGAFAASRYREALNLVAGGGLFSPITRGVEDEAAEALTLQAQLHTELSTGSIANAPFTFRAIDRHAGNVLGRAVSLVQDTPEIIDEAAKRVEGRFAFSYPLVNYHPEDTFISKKPRKESQMNTDILGLDKYKERSLKNSIMIRHEPGLFKD